MQKSLSKPEIVLVVLALLIGVGLRLRHLEQTAIEHFDEGVYASSTWYDGEFQAPYPARHLYAPPLLQTCIEAASSVMGGSRYAVFVPSLVFGCGTILIMWWMARSFFGLAAGVFVSFLVALSDFHILYSRMVLTDVPVLFWIAGSVFLGTRAIHRQSYRLMICAGLTCGLAWWTKYSGWLPVAIIASGSTFWWIKEGRRSYPLRMLIMLLLTMAAVSVLTWLPWYLALQDVGGYQAVAANHRSYMSGLHGWQDRLADQLTYHFTLDSWMGAAAIAIGLLLAGIRRWVGTLRSTWNGQTDRATRHGFPPSSVLMRFVVSAVALGVVALTISSIGLLTCVAVGGLAGQFLWPVLLDLHRRREQNDHSAVDQHAFQFTDEDLRAAPDTNPVLGASIILAWLAGMLLATPMYHPFPRLSLPLLAAVWLAAAGGISWWIEASLNVARRGSQFTELHTERVSRVRQLISTMALAAVGLSVYVVITAQDSLWLDPSQVWAPRTSLRQSSWTAADICLKNAAGEYSAPNGTMPSGGIVSPGSVTDGQLNYGAVAEWDVSKPTADPQQPECVVYAFGEPAVLYHLHQAGLAVAPVQDLNFSEARFNGNALPTYLILGPNALRTPGLLNTWAIDQNRFEHLANVAFEPSPVVLLNLFRVDWIRQHPECRQQILEVYRLRSDTEQD